MADIEVHIDALMPPDTAGRAGAIGIRKAKLDFWTMFSLAILAGLFISTGCEPFPRRSPTGASCFTLRRGRGCWPAWPSASA